MQRVGNHVATLAQRSAAAGPHKGRSHGREHDKELPNRAAEGITPMLVQAVGGRIAAHARRARVKQRGGGDAERGQQDDGTGAKLVHDVCAMLLGAPIALQLLQCLLCSSCLQPLVALYPCP